MSIFFHAVTHWSWVSCSLLSSINPPQEAGIFEMTGLRIVCSLLQQVHFHTEKVEQALHKELQSGCEHACQPQAITTTHCSQRPLACPSSRGKTQSCGYKSYVWLFSLFLLMASEMHCDLGCGINVAFGSVQCCAIWQPLHASLLLTLTGLDEARLLLLLRGADTSNIFKSETNLWRTQRSPGYCGRQVWRCNSCPFICATKRAKQKSLPTLQFFIVSCVTPLHC